MIRIGRCILIVATLAIVLSLCFGQGTIRTGQSIRAVASGSTDIDGDPIQYEFAWDVDGVPRPEYDTMSPAILPPYDETASSVIPAGIIIKGETWRVRVRAGDGEDYSAWVTAQVVVGGVPPTDPAVYIEAVE